MAHVTDNTNDPDCYYHCGRPAAKVVMGLVFDTNDRCQLTVCDTCQLPAGLTKVGMETLK